QAGVPSAAHTRAVLSAPAVAMRPSGSQIAPVVSPSCARIVSSAPPAASQVRAVPSSERVSRRDPSGLHATPFTRPSWPTSVATGARLSASRTRAVLSWAAVARRRPSGLHARATMRPSWPDIRWSRLPVRASHTAADLSWLAVAMRLPSGEYAAIAAAVWAGSTSPLRSSHCSARPSGKPTSPAALAGGGGQVDERAHGVAAQVGQAPLVEMELRHTRFGLVAGARDPHHA